MEPERASALGNNRAARGIGSTDSEVVRIPPRDADDGCRRINGGQHPRKRVGLDVRRRDDELPGSGAKADQRAARPTGHA